MQEVQHTQDIAKKKKRLNFVFKLVFINPPDAEKLSFG